MKLSLWSSFNIQNKRFCSSSKNKGTYANDAKNVNKDSPIVLGWGETGSWLPLLDYFSRPKIRKRR